MEPQPFTEALEIIAEVMKQGAAIHPSNDWLERSAEYHSRRAIAHLQTWEAGGQIQDNISHAAPPRDC
jgi:hypothetical protein